MSMRGTPVITGTALFVVAAAVVTYLSQSGRADSGMKVTDIFTAATTTTRTVQARFVPYGWREYRSTAYRFSLLYPEALKVQEYIEGGNALTVTFQNVKKGEGFQLFITPYAQGQISDARFKKDIPSGVRIGLTETTIDGATGAAFYSESAVLGETREVWFVHGGFLFEATAPKPLERWLDEIMRTWQFI